MNDDNTVEQMTKFLLSKGWLKEKGEAQYGSDIGWFVYEEDFKPKLKYTVMGYGCDGYGCRTVVCVDDELVAEFWVQAKGKNEL